MKWFNVVILTVGIVLILGMIALSIWALRRPPIWVLSSFKYTNEKVNNTAKVVISTTTIPGRLPHLQNIIDNMYEQYYRADEMYLNIPYICRRNGEKYDEIEIQKLDTKRGWVKIVRCKDYGPATKLLGCFPYIKDPNTIIITVDDDQDYQRELIGFLVYFSVRYPNSALATEMMTYEMEKCIHAKKICSDPLKAVYIEGFGGVLYRRRFFDDWCVEFIDNIAKQCLVSDDLVLSTLLALKGIRRMKLQCGGTRTDNSEIDAIDALKNDRRKYMYTECQKLLLRTFMRVPEKLHFNYFGWDGPKLPVNFKKCLNKLTKLHPSFEIQVHGKDIIEHLVKKYSPRLEQVYNNVPKRVMKSDIGRLLLLYKYGGFYLDLDIDGKKSLLLCSQLYPGKKVYLFTEQENDKNPEKCTRVANYAIGCTPKHPFIDLCLRLIMDRCTTSSPDFPVESDDYVIWSTGPDISSTACHLVLPQHSSKNMDQEHQLYSELIQKINPSDVQVIPKEVSDAMFRHEAHGTWRIKKLD